MLTGFLSSQRLHRMAMLFSAYTAPQMGGQSDKWSRLWRQYRPRLNTGSLGGWCLLLVVLACFLSLPWSIAYFNTSWPGVEVKASPQSELALWMGTDELARPMLFRILLGGVISLSIGIFAAFIAVVIGVTWGTLAGYIGGRTDAIMMRIVDVLYSLPYILLVVLIDMALSPQVEDLAAWLMPDRWELQVPPKMIGEVASLLIAIGCVSWLTLSRVIRGQVLSLKNQPFVESARAVGVGPWRLMRWHLLPNLLGPIIVYTTLTVPNAILQESFLSFLGIGITDELPSWGNLAKKGLQYLHGLGGGSSQFRWWLVVWPCIMLGVTLMALNFVGDALRDRFDPKGRTKAG